jgi:hypothetical protein
VHTAAAETERKYLLPDAQADQLVALLSARLSPEVHDVTRPVAYARTTYLDTAGLTLFATSDGVVRRRLRVREYAAASRLGAPPELTGVCFLELKESAGVQRSKVRFPGRVEEIRRIVSGRREPQWLRCLAEHPHMREIGVALENRWLQPCVATWYRRISFAGDHLRVTVDAELSYARPALPGAPIDPEAVVQRAPMRVLEIKAMAPWPAWLSRALAAHRPAPGFSKFREGVLALKLRPSGSAEGECNNKRSLP